MAVSEILEAAVWQLMLEGSLGELPNSSLEGRLAHITL